MRSSIFTACRSFIVRGAAAVLQFAAIVGILTLVGCGSKSEFESLPLNGTPDGYYSPMWNLRSSVHIENLPAGLVCIVQSKKEPTGTPYGGIRLPGRGAKGFRLDLAFMDPDEIVTCYVDAYNARRQRVARWETRKGLTLSDQRGTYKFIPKQAPAGFGAVASNARGPIDDIHIFLRVSPGKRAGFVIYKAELLH